MAAKNCCFFIDLRLGCIIIAIISLINPISMIINDFVGELHVFPFLVHSLLVAVTVLLLLGIIQGRKFYFYLYLILEGISLAVLVFYSILGLIAIVSVTIHRQGADQKGNDNQDDLHNMTVGFIWSSTSLAVYVYFYYIVYSYYMQLNTVVTATPLADRYEQQQQQ